MSNFPSKGSALMAYTRFSLERSTPSLWRVTFDNPPINLIDPVMIVALDDLLTEIEQDNRVAVVVFDSADPDFFLAHYDIAADQSALDALPAARTPFHHWANVLIRLSRSRAVTISALRGRARGAGSEFALATDIRFASRERAVLGQFEVGFAAVPGGGPSTRLPGIVGRGRAFEILLGGEDFDGEIAERYGRQPRRSRREVRRVRQCFRGARLPFRPARARRYQAFGQRCVASCHRHADRRDGRLRGGRRRSGRAFHHRAGARAWLSAAQ